MNGALVCVGKLRWVGGRFILALFIPLQAHSTCSAPANPTEAENYLPGNPRTEWDIPTSDAGDAAIQGLADDISFKVGATVNFKVNTPATGWNLEIYRIGYYQRNGARLISTVQPSVPLPQMQPACISDPTTVAPSLPPAATTTGLLDRGNWAVSASWTILTTAAPGIYFSKATRSETGGTSHIVFIVRNDASNSGILFQASDTPWKAYNPYWPNFYG